MFDFVGQVAGTKIWSLRLDFFMKISSSQEGTWSQGLVPLCVPTLSSNFACNGAAKQVSAGVEPCNMIGFVKLLRTSVARQVSRRVEPLSTSGTTRNGRSGEKLKQEFDRVTQLRETVSQRRCTKVSDKSFNV